MREEDSQKISLQINPEEYKKMRLKLLGNHFVYSKLEQTQKWNDKRIKLLKPDYFKDRFVLDVGCNQGIMTIPIAIKYQPKLIQGIDIDNQLVKRLEDNKQKFAYQYTHLETPKEYIKQAQDLPLFFQQKISKMYSSALCQIDQKHELLMEGKNQFPANLKASTQNIFALDSNQIYQCILCMNVTKWIHLAFGDIAIETLFNKMNSLLEEDGILILQAQPWKSYYKKKKLFKKYQKNYGEIVLRPERFGENLVKLGFIEVERIVACSENQLKHDIMIYQKRGH